MDKIEAVISHYTDDEAVDLSRYHIDYSGENNVTIICPGLYDGVLKVSRDIQGVMLRNKVQYEAYVLEYLETCDAPSPPLEVPTLVECVDSATPYYFAMRKMPGRSVGFVEGSQLSVEEKARVGTAIGRFAAWMATTVSRESYNDILWDSRSCIAGIPSRDNWLQRYMGGRGSDWLDKHGYYALSNTLDMNYRHYRRLEREGRLKPTIIGHDDLSIINLKMQPDDEGLLTPVAVLDFEYTKPTTPERELRFAWAMGEAAGKAAKCAYEEATGIELSEELLSFWAVAQRITNAVYSVNRPEPYGGVEHLTAIANELEWLVPAEDWSEIKHADFSGRQGDELLKRLHPPGVTFIRRNGTFIPN